MKHFNFLIFCTAVLMACVPSGKDQSTINAAVNSHNLAVKEILHKDNIQRIDAAGQLRIEYLKQGMQTAEAEKKAADKTDKLFRSELSDKRLKEYTYESYIQECTAERVDPVESIPLKLIEYNPKN